MRYKVIRNASQANPISPGKSYSSKQITQASFSPKQYDNLGYVRSNNKKTTGHKTHIRGKSNIRWLYVDWELLISRSIEL
jgi:hypothetical protein